MAQGAGMACEHVMLVGAMLAEGARPLLVGVAEDPSSGHAEWELASTAWTG